jgi:hypothetical protein
MLPAQGFGLARKMADADVERIEQGRPKLTNAARWKLMDEAAFYTVARTRSGLPSPPRTPGAMLAKELLDSASKADASKWSFLARLQATVPAFAAVGIVVGVPTYLTYRLWGLKGDEREQAWCKWALRAVNDPDQVQERQGTSAIMFAGMVTANIVLDGKYRAANVALCAISAWTVLRIRDLTKADHF